MCSLYDRLQGGVLKQMANFRSLNQSFEHLDILSSSGFRHSPWSLLPLGALAFAPLC